MRLKVGGSEGVDVDMDEDDSSRQESRDHGTELSTGDILDTDHTQHTTSGSAVSAGAGKGKGKGAGLMA